MVGVIGRVGSGKSSLLSVILAEMNRLQGEVSVRGLSQGFALAAQESWIQNATVRDNILFHQPYDVARYEAVVWACALTEDLKVWMWSKILYTKIVQSFYGCDQINSTPR